MSQALPLACAGGFLPEPLWLMVVADALTALCGGSAALAADLFCGGVLGGVMRVAQRLVAAQPGAGRDPLARRLVRDEAEDRDDLGFVVEAFGRAVPQARGYLPASASGVPSI